MGKIRSVSRAVDKALDMSHAARMERAREMGFDTDTAWYHGANRIDRVLEKEGLDPRRATSGPMPFFTDDPALASSYAKGKADTSRLSDFDNDYSTWFKVNTGRGKPKPFTQAWYYLDPQEKSELLEKLGRVSYDDDYNIVMGEGPGGQAHWEWALREARGNPLEAAQDVWLNSGILYGEEEKFADVLRAGGFRRPVMWDAPHMEVPGVLRAYARVNNPLDTSDTEALQKVYERLKAASKGRRYKSNREGVDLWDKSNIGIREFTDRLGNDLDTGETLAWTSIPDVVTDELRAMGYDGIRDVGGKGGGAQHNVLIPFDPSQVRSTSAAFDPAKKASPNLLAGSAAAAVGLGALQPEESSAMTVAAQDFIQRREARRGEWQARKENLLRTIAEASNTAMSALEMPWRGYLGLSRVGGGLLAGEGLDQALMQGAQMTQQPVEATADQLGGAVVDATGSPALGTAVNVGVNLGGPI